jgi:hypothetical protein
MSNEFAEHFSTCYTISGIYETVSSVDEREFDVRNRLSR